MGGVGIETNERTRVLSCTIPGMTAAAAGIQDGWV